MALMEAPPPAGASYQPSDQMMVVNNSGSEVVADIEDQAVLQFVRWRGDCAQAGEREADCLSADQRT